jgi:ribosomal protein S18 acetylase RimI-like enzyme
MHPLDNVIWKALTTNQAHFAEISDLARRFFPEISLLGAIEQPTAKAYDSLARLIGTKPVGLFLEEPPQMPASWSVESAAPMLEMVYEEPSIASDSRLTAAPATQFIDLSAAESPQMMTLAKLTNPGPFAQRTHELGTYLGIYQDMRQDRKLIAMAGERLRLPGYTEISAVCTHPDYLGRGYAATLMKELLRRINLRGERVFLHVRTGNTRATELYGRLGFRVRVQLYYAIVRFDGN